MRVTFDRVIGSTYESTLDQITIRRGFVATEIDNNQPEDVIRAAIVQRLPQRYTPHPTEPGARVVGYSINLIGDTQSAGAVIYQTPRLPDGGSINTYYYSTRTYLQQINTEVSPLDHVTPLISTYTQSVAAGVADKNDKPQGTATNAPYYRPMKVFEASGTFTSPMTPIVEDSPGTVNDSPFRRLVAGWWLVFDASQQTNDGGRTWQIKITLLSLATEDWSTYIVSRLSNGRVVPIRSNSWEAVRNKPYAATPGRPIASANGVSRYGFYIPMNFAQAFGFKNF